MARQHYNTDQTLSWRRSAGAEPHVGSVLSLPTPEQGCPLPALPPPRRARLPQRWLLPSALDFKYFKSGCFWTLGFSRSKLYRVCQSWGIIWGGVPPQGRAGRGSSPSKVLHLLSSGLTAAGLELG